MTDPQKPIQHVEQEDRSGCGIAVAAMLKGLTYQDVRRWWLAVHRGDEFTLKAAGGGIRKHELADLLDTIQAPHPIVQAPCVVIIQSPSNPMPWCGHYVVITKDGTILDPLSSTREPEYQI